MGVAEERREEPRYWGEIENRPEAVRKAAGASESQQLETAVLLGGGAVRLRTLSADHRRRPRESCGGGAVVDSNQAPHWRWLETQRFESRYQQFVLEEYVEAVRRAQLRSAAHQ